VFLYLSFEFCSPFSFVSNYFFIHTNYFALCSHFFVTLAFVFASSSLTAFHRFIFEFPSLKHSFVQKCMSIRPIKPSQKLIWLKIAILSAFKSIHITTYCRYHRCLPIAYSPVKGKNFVIQKLFIFVHYQ
jgi:hypothetical protein